MQYGAGLHIGTRPTSASSPGETLEGLVFLFAQRLGVLLQVSPEKGRSAKGSRAEIRRFIFSRSAVRRRSIAVAVLALFATASSRAAVVPLAPSYGFDSTLMNIRDIAYDQSTNQLIAHKAWGYGSTGLAVIDPAQTPADARIVGSIAVGNTDYNNAFAPVGSLDHTNSSMTVVGEDAVPASTLLLLIGNGGSPGIDYLQSEPDDSVFSWSGFAENNNVGFAFNPNSSTYPIVTAGEDTADGYVIRAIQPKQSTYLKVAFSTVPSLPGGFTPTAIEFGPVTGHLYVAGDSSDALYELDYDPSAGTLSLIREFDLGLTGITIAGLAFDDPTGELYVSGNNGSNEGWIYRFPIQFHEAPEPSSIVLLCGGLVLAALRRRHQKSPHC